MAKDDDKWVQLVAKLNALTQDKKLTWTGPTNRTYQGGKTFKEYTARYKDKAFRLRDAPQWGLDPRYVTLSIVQPTDTDSSLFDFPSVVGLSDLADSVMYQKAGIQDLLDD